MKRPAPTDEFQVVFLRQVQRILAEGNFVASYKYALLHALADLAVLNGDDTDEPLRLSTRNIAERFIELYWRQALPFPGHEGALRQNSGKQAAVVRLVDDARRTSGGSLHRLRQTGTTWTSLVRDVEKVVKAQPIWKLQTVGTDRLDFLYDNLDGGSTITLKAGVAYCLRAFHGLVTELVRAAWLRYVRQRNIITLGSATDLAAFMFGTDRGDLSRHAAILKDLQKGDCFYCARSVGKSCEVDHFIPWSRYPVDLGHNFVLAHGGCNKDKSDALAAVRHLERWCERNEVLGASLARDLDDEGLPHDLAASKRIAVWAYEQADVAGARLWLAPKADLVPIEPRWRRLPGLMA